jgi:hypothetical protein
MFLWVSLVLLLSTHSFAEEEVGKILKMAGEEDAFVLRNNKKITITKDTSLRLGDEISSSKTVLLIFLEPSTQMSIGVNTILKISKNLLEENGKKVKSTSIIDLVKGMVRLQVTKFDDLEIDQKIQSKDVAFGVRGTEFEVSNDGENVDLDVVGGEVTVSSPHVQTFVPEAVKTKEGFRYNMNRRQFQRRQFLERFNNHLGFQSLKYVRRQWINNSRKLKIIDRRVRKQICNSSRLSKRQKQKYGCK